MSSGQASSRSELARDRAATEAATRPPRGAAVRNAIMASRSWLGARLGRLSSSALARTLLALIVGFAAGAAWQSYGSAGRQAVAGWSPHLAWLAPATAPANVSPERLRAMSRALATARQSLDTLATEISRMQTRDGNAPRRRSAH